MEPFVSSIKFPDHHSDHVVVCCSDGRTRPHVVEFINNLGIEADLYVIPGGPIVFTSGVEVFQDSSLAEKRIKFLVEVHKSKRIILIAHGSEEESAQCAMAKILFPHITPRERVAKQKSALLKAEKLFSTTSNLPVDSYYANVIEGTVTFEPVTE